jgi:general secretion pathway protein J
VAVLSQWLAEKLDDSAHLPDGVELTLTMENGDTWRWVFTTPGDMPDAAVAPQPGAETAAPAAENAPAPDVKS